MTSHSDGSITYEVSIDIRDLLSNSGRVRAELLKLSENGETASKGINKLEQSASSAGSSLGKLSTIAKAVSAALVSSQILAYAQSWNELEDRIGNTGATASQTKDIMDQLLETSNRNGRSIEESSELYIRLSNSMKEFGYSTNDTLSYIDTLSNLMTINKTSAMGAQSAINALTKAQIAGKLSGENANSVFNAMPSILKTLGTQLNKTETEVKSMAANGELSMTQFSSAMIKAQSETATFADNMRNNVNDGITRVTNNLKQYLGELNNSTGATKVLVDSLILMSEHVDVLVTGLGVLAAIYAGKYITSLASATKQSAANTLASIKQATAEKTLAQSALATAQAETVRIKSDQQSLSAQLALAQTERTRTAIRTQLRENTLRLTAATNAETAAQARLNVAMKASSFAANGLKSAMAMLGGPAGIVLLAAGALYSFVTSTEKAKESVIDLKKSVSELTEEYKKLDEASKETFKEDLSNDTKKSITEIDSAASKLRSTFRELSETAYNTSAGIQFMLTDEDKQRVNDFNAKLNELNSSVKNGAITHAEYASSITALWKSGTENLNITEKQRSKFVELGQTLSDNASKILTSKGVIDEVSKSTEKLTEAVKQQNQEFSKDTVSNISKSIEKLGQEAEIAELKQKGLTKQAYIYQGALTALGAEAEKYKQSLLGLILGTATLADLTEDQATTLEPLIKSLSKMYDLNESGSTKVKKSASAIKELKDNIAVARLEVKGAISDAKELKALQEAKATGSTQAEINQIIELTKEYEKLQLAKSGESFAKEQVNNNLTEAQKVAIEQQARLEELNKWYDTGLANEQLYQDAYNAIIDEGIKERQKIEDKEVSQRLANTQAILGASGDLFGGLADLTKTFSSEQSTAYKAMFAISKGFAVANAAINLQTAISNASTAPWPTNLGFMAQAAAQGTQIASSIASLSYGGGREHGGTVGANSMYRVGEGNKPEILMAGGRQYMIPGESGKVISNSDIGSSKSGLNVIINNYGNDDVETSQSGDNNQMIIDIAAKKGAEMGYQKVSESISNHSGSVWTSLTQNTNTKAKL